MYKLQGMACGRFYTFGAMLASTFEGGLEYTVVVAEGLHVRGSGLELGRQPRLGELDSGRVSVDTRICLRTTARISSRL
jgi:hypothetical protein